MAGCWPAPGEVAQRLLVGTDVEPVLAAGPTFAPASSVNDQIAWWMVEPARFGAKQSLFGDRPAASSRRIFGRA
jgi:hypothetical protein